MEKQDIRWTTFSTSIGICGVSWKSQEVTAFFLPEASGKSVEKRLKRLPEIREPQLRRDGLGSSSKSESTYGRSLAGFFFRAFTLL